MANTTHVLIKAYAKVNLVLDVLGKESSGYHLIQTILHEVHSLYDVIEFEKGSGGVSFSCANPLLMFDESNTVVKAISLFEKHFGKKVTGKFFVTKNIPLRSGLGGGSSDAAATLKLLAREYEVSCCGVDPVEGCHEQECPLFALAVQIGMDVPFFINGGTQLAIHYGEQLTPLLSAAPFFDCEILAADVHTKVSTAHAYNQLDISLCGKNIEHTRNFLQALADGDSQKMFDSLHNDFDKNPTSDGSMKIMLTGSGGAKVRIMPKTHAFPS